MRKILIVDDDANARMTLRRLLTNERTAFLEAENGAQGLEVAQRERPDIIMLDLMMPVLDGIETVSLLRKDPSTREIPVVIVSAIADRDHLKDLAAYGVSGYLLKPVDGRVVREKVAEILRSKPQKTLPSNADHPSVLVAHRNPKARKVIEETLSPIGFHFSEAQTGPGAMDAFRREHPTLACLDLELPFYNALETARRVQTTGTADGESTFILMVSSRDKQLTAEMQALGFRSILPWPCSADEVLLAVDHAYGSCGFFPLYYSDIPVLHLTGFTENDCEKLEDLAKRIITATRGFLSKGFPGVVVNFAASDSAGQHAGDLMSTVRSFAGSEFSMLHTVLDEAHARKLAPAGISVDRIHQTLAEAVRTLAG